MPSIHRGCRVADVRPGWLWVRDVVRSGQVTSTSQGQHREMKAFSCHTYSKSHLWKLTSKGKVSYEMTPREQRVFKALLLTLQLGGAKVTHGLINNPNPIRFTMLNLNAPPLTLPFQVCIRTYGCQQVVVASFQIHTHAFINVNKVSSFNLDF